MQQRCRQPVGAPPPPPTDFSAPSNIETPAPPTCPGTRSGHATPRPADIGVDTEIRGLTPPPPPSMLDMAPGGDMPPAAPEPMMAAEPLAAPEAMMAPATEESGPVHDLSAELGLAAAPLAMPPEDDIPSYGEEGPPKLDVGGTRR